MYGIPNYQMFLRQELVLFRRILPCGTYLCEKNMRISVEISKYPLDAKYGNAILDFIQRLNNHPEIKVQTNNMSTQIFGAYDQIMDILHKEMKASFAQPETIVMVMKFVNEDLR